jgi:hypothetical protein
MPNPIRIPELVEGLLFLRYRVAEGKKGHPFDKLRDTE